MVGEVVEGQIEGRQVEVVVGVEVKAETVLNLGSLNLGSLAICQMVQMNQMNQMNQMIQMTRLLKQYIGYLYPSTNEVLTVYCLSMHTTR